VPREKLAAAKARIEALLKQFPRPRRERRRAKACDKGLTIQILGREFRVACPEGEESSCRPPSISSTAA
jgi:hypothetical protein